MELVWDAPFQLPCCPMGATPGQSGGRRRPKDSFVAHVITSNWSRSSATLQPQSLPEVVVIVELHASSIDRWFPPRSLTVFQATTATICCCSSCPLSESNCAKFDDTTIVRNMTTTDGGGEVGR
ncbi:unnamed protein product [Soboliphyme baturini]|uniref:Uncharacterized protein n=1 Tax=Soboliphyme baturini TaxID=241478 RepID=A0A183IY84_9BILA|nr:unnamed protein product [Soboliphyme baturini]